MMILCYPSKKAIVEKIGHRLEYIETSFFGAEYPEDGNGRVLGCNRPFSLEYGQSSKRCFDGFKKDGSRKKVREFFANVTLVNHLITKVE